MRNFTREGAAVSAWNTQGSDTPYPRRRPCARRGRRLPGGTPRQERGSGRVRATRAHPRRLPGGGRRIPGGGATGWGGLVRGYTGRTGAAATPAGVSPGGAATGANGAVSGAHGGAIGRRLFPAATGRRGGYPVRGRPPGRPIPGAGYPRAGHGGTATGGRGGSSRRATRGHSLPALRRRVTGIRHCYHRGRLPNPGAAGLPGGGAQKKFFGGAATGAKPDARLFCAYIEALSRSVRRGYSLYKIAKNHLCFSSGCFFRRPE